MYKAVRKSYHGFFLTRFIKYKPGLRASIFAMNDDYVFYTGLTSAGANGYIHRATSRKVVGKSARDNTERHCGWF